MAKDHSATKERIAAQKSIVAALSPGSDEHRLATNVLLLLQDSLHLLVEVERMTAVADQLKTKSGS